MTNAEIVARGVAIDVAKEDVGVLDMAFTFI
jgi:hypothetical protein